MAIIYDAQLRPSKTELLVQWLPSQPWFEGDAAALERLGAFRFDDPAGEVGLETHLIAVDGKTYQVPLSYRGAPLAGAEEFLITTMEHSVLGTRWVYDAAGDPAYAGELAAALLAGKPQAVQMVQHADGTQEALPHTAVLSSSGTDDAGLPDPPSSAFADGAGSTRIAAGEHELLVLRVLDVAGTAHTGPALTVTWEGQQLPVLVSVAVRS